MTHRLYIFGGRSTAVEIAEVARAHLTSVFDQVLHVVPDKELSESDSAIPISALRSHVEANHVEADRFEANHAGRDRYILSMSDPTIRQDCLTIAEEAGLQPANVIHPSAEISPSAQIGHGVYIAALAVVSSEAIVEDHVIINYQTTIGHHSKIGSHSQVNPGARVGGNVVIGKRVLLGANSFVFQNKRIGDDTQVDALTYIDRDIEAGMICTSREIKILKRPYLRRPISESK